MEKNLTSGSVFKNIIFFSLPYLLSYFLQTLYGMADLLIIGIFGKVSDTTAVSVGSQIMHMITVIIVGLAMGTTVSIAQAVGAKENKKASLVIGNTALIFFIFSVILTAVLICLIDPIVAAMSTPAQAVGKTADYLTVCILGIPFITAYNVISSVFRGMGDSKSPLYFIGAACFFNIVLDFVFMGALNMGPRGAALGTTLSQALSVVLSLIFILRKNSGIVIKKSDFKPKKDIILKILKIGIPIACQDGLIQIAFIVITVIANLRGLTDSAAVGIVEKIISFLFLVPSTMLSTVSALGAQNIGAKKPRRAALTLKYAVFIAAGFGIIVSILIQFISGPVVSLFTDDKKVIFSGSQYLRGYIFDCIFAGIHFSFSGYFCAIGRSELSFIHNILSIVLVRIPAVFLTSKLFADTLFPMGLATAAGSLVSVIICLIMFSILKARQAAKSL